MSEITTIRDEIVNKYNLEWKDTEDQFNRLEQAFNKLNIDTGFDNVIHVTGTNGSSSTSHFIGKLLMEHGHNVGLFSNLIVENKFTQFFNVNENFPTDDELWDLADQVYEKTELKDEWEFIVTMALLRFSSKDVDTVVLEAGIGGLEDATNVLRSDLVAITSIGLDHDDYFDGNIEKVAYRKAGLLNENSIGVVNYPDQSCYDTVTSYVDKVNAQVFAPMQIVDYYRNEDELFYTASYNRESFETNIMTNYMFWNINTALTLLEYSDIEIDKEITRKVIEEFQLPGRGEVFDSTPTIICDGASNEQSFEAITDNIIDNIEDVVTLLSVREEERSVGESIVEQVTEYSDKVVLTRYKNDLFEEYEIEERIKDPQEAIKKLQEEHQNKTILVTGDKHMIYIVRQAINK